MTRQNVQIFLVAVLLIGVAGVAPAQTEELVRTIPMEPGGRFTLGNISGEITVTGVDGDDLTIRATKRVAGRGSAAADALDRVEIDIEERGNRVVVETDYPRHRRSFLQSLASLLRGGERVPFVAVDYLVTVPRDTGVAIESFDGDVTVEGVDGETHVKTVSGDGRLASRGRVPARRGGDGIGIGDLRRRARCRRPVRIAFALRWHLPDGAGRLGIRAGCAVLQRRPAFRHSHPRRPGRPVPPHARLRGRTPRDSRDCRRRRRPPETVHRQRRHGNRYTRFHPAATGCIATFGIY